MLLSFIFLNLSCFVLLCLVRYFNEQNKTYPIYFLFVLLIFYTPSIYYFFGGTSYRVFNDDTYSHYMNYSSLIIWINSIFLIIKNSTSVKPVKNAFLTRLKNEQINIYVVAYFGVILLLILGYIGLYFQEFPLISFLLNGVLLDRPDTSGAIPHFYTLSTIMLFIVPSIYIYLFNHIKYKITHVIILCFVALILTISGHKGMITFFFIFYWYFVLERKINLKFIIIIGVLFTVYAATKGISNLNYETAEYMMTSPFRRFFVTQGACMISRFHMMDIGYVLNAVDPIKNQVCEVMHGGVQEAGGCSAPTFFIGDILLRYGYVVATIVYIASVALIFWVIKNVDVLYPDNLFVKWNLFCIFFLTGMVEISEHSIFRILLIIIHIYLTCLLASLKFDPRTLAHYFQRYSQVKENL